MASQLRPTTVICTALGDAQLQHLGELGPFYPAPAPGQAEEVLVPPDVPQADHKAGRLGHHRGQGRPPDTPVEGPHKQAVQHDVDPPPSLPRSRKAAGSCPRSGAWPTGHCTQRWG